MFVEISLAGRAALGLIQIFLKKFETAMVSIQAGVLTGFNY
jgi:hypothetical protein